MKQFLRKFMADDVGQDIAEYAIALAVIATVTIFAAQAIGLNVGGLWTTASVRIASVAGN